jgi:hypothetical protein
MNESRFIQVFDELKKIERSLHHIDEVDCSYERTPRGAKASETREKNLVARAKDLAKSIGFEIYRQGDCRGCALYIWKKSALKKYNNRWPDQKPMPICQVYDTVGIACC